MMGRDLRNGDWGACWLPGRGGLPTLAPLRKEGRLSPELEGTRGFWGWTRVPPASDLTAQGLFPLLCHGRQVVSSDTDARRK